MAKKFKSLNDLFKYIKDEVADSMNEIGKEAEQEVKNQLEVDVYSFQPKVYERTYDLQNSVVYSKPIINKNTVMTTIFHDTSLINSDPDKFQHGSHFWNPKDMREAIPIIVHEGLSGPLFGTTGFWNAPRPYMDNAKEKMENEKFVYKEMKKSLESKGFKVK